MKPLTIIFLLLTIPYLGFSQFALGLSAGINNSRFDSPAPHYLEPRNRLFVEVSPTYQLNEKWTIRTNIQYVQKGEKLEQSFGNQGATIKTSFKLHLDYIEAIPEISYQILPVLSVGVGPSIGFEIREGATQKSSSSFFNQDEILVDFHEDLIAGGVFTVKGHYRNMMLFARYNRGFTKTFDVIMTDGQGVEIGREKAYTQSFQVGVGYEI